VITQIKGLAEVYTWGEGASGQLGHGDTISRRIPARVEALSGKGILYSKNVNSVSCGILHAGVVNSFGEAFTWGSNFFMQVGHEHSAGGLLMALDEKEPTPGSLKAHLPKGFTCKSIACGGWHTLLLGDLHTKRGLKRAVFAWGNGGQGQLGLLEKEKYHISTRKGEASAARMPWMYAKHPEELPQLTKDNKDPDRIVMLAAGAVHSIALTEKGDVYWWGENRYVTTPEKLDLMTEEPDLKFRYVACGAFHSLGVTTDGKVYSWGAGRVNPEAPLHAQLDPHMIIPVDSVAPPKRYKFTQIEIENVASVAAADDASLALTCMLPPLPSICVRW
jgi:alpha-tubulin suppressor-like RCC1 family protein